MPRRLELKPAELRRFCTPSRFSFEDTSEIPSLDRVIGQERAVLAIEFGLTLRGEGYHIFVSGPEGTGRHTIVRDLVQRLARTRPAPDDWCLVNNFADEFRPRAVALPPGRGPAFAKKIHRLVEDLKREIPAAFETEDHRRRLAALKSRHAARQQALVQKIERRAAEWDLQLDSQNRDFPIVPLLDGRPLAPEELSSLPEPTRREIDERVRRMQAELEKSARQLEASKRRLQAGIERLMNQAVSQLLRRRLAPLRREYSGRKAVLDYLAALQADIVENFNRFFPSERKEDGAEGGPPAERPALLPYRVNVLVHRPAPRGAPVVYEGHPTYVNLFGRIEKRMGAAGPSTDFTRVLAGSLLQANGGYLILEIEPLLGAPAAWEALKRALLERRADIEELSEESSPAVTPLRPEPIPLAVKVILLGNAETFAFLQNFDPRFNKIFRVRADFDEEVERTAETEQLYARFIARVCREEKLLPFDRRAVAAVVEFGQKLAEHQNKLSLRFGVLLGLLQEADHWARRQRARRVSDRHVTRAFREHRFRCSLYEQKVLESFREGVIRLEVTGERVGQINGLALYAIGEYAFGRPVRITAEAFRGKAGVINIEREVELSGRTHDKGVLILSGFLGGRFARAFPLHLTISLTFEQHYNEVDGDSASAAELFAILSCLSGFPLRQGIAVTGSVDQKGGIQAIGGVNRKIEGFFDVCRDKGLNGAQGVILPAANVRHLMLRRDVLEAVRRRRFHVWAIRTVEEGIELLTGVRAGRPDRRGRYPAGSLFGEIERRLKGFAEPRRRAAGEEDGEEA